MIAVSEAMVLLTAPEGEDWGVELRRFLRKVLRSQANGEWLRLAVLRRDRPTERAQFRTDMSVYSQLLVTSMCPPLAKTAQRKGVEPRSLTHRLYSGAETDCARVKVVSLHCVVTGCPL